MYWNIAIAQVGLNQMYMLNNLQVADFRHFSPWCYIATDLLQMLQCARFAAVTSSSLSIENHYRNITGITFQIVLSTCNTWHIITVVIVTISIWHAFEIYWTLIIDMVSIEASAHNDEKRHRDGDRTIIGLITWGEFVEHFRCKIDWKKTVISASFLLKLCWHFSLLHSCFFQFFPPFCCKWNVCSDDWQIINR